MDSSDIFSHASDTSQAAISDSEQSSPSLDLLQARRGDRDPHETGFVGRDDGVSVHPGFPNPAADRRLKSLDLNSLLIERPSSTFMFRIRGEEGITQGIFDGDIAVVDRAANPRTNDFVLWHDGARFKMSRPARLTDGATQWGVITAVIHQYHTKGN